VLNIQKPFRQFSLHLDTLSGLQACCDQTNNLPDSTPPKLLEGMNKLVIINTSSVSN